MTKQDYLNLTIHQRINLRSKYNNLRRFKLCIDLNGLIRFPECSQPLAFQDYFLNKTKSEKFKAHF